MLTRTICTLPSCSLDVTPSHGRRLARVLPVVCISASTGFSRSTGTNMLPASRRPPPTASLVNRLPMPISSPFWLKSGAPLWLGNGGLVKIAESMWYSQ